MTVINTDRITLIPATIEFVELLIAQRYERAGKLLNISVPHGWPSDVEARDGLIHHLRAMKDDARESLWRIRLIVLRETRAIIGSINLKGQPTENGDVEIGWGVNPEYRKQRIATEAAREVIAWAFSQDAVRRIIATIPEDNIASQRVAKHLGMRLTNGRKRGLPVWALDKSASLLSIKLKRAHVDEMFAHARQMSPAECCGLVGGTLHRVQSIYHLRNVASDTLVGYEAAPEDLFAAQRSMRQRGEELLGIYHSHPRSREPVPSETDVRLAYYPSAVYFIIGLSADSETLRAFRISERDGRWERVEYAVVDD